MINFRVIFYFAFLACNLVFGERFDSGLLQREKRYVWLTFPINTATGILVAIAVPLDIPKRNVFVSYNFEANYNVPTAASDIIPGALTRWDYVDRNRELGRSNNDNSDNGTSLEMTKNSDIITDVLEKDQSNGTNRHLSKRYVQRPQLLTRKKIYKIITKKLDGAGFKGKACLLQAICEAAEYPLGEHNGVLGDIVHVIFTPSSSEDENIHPEYYKAEELGKMGNCKKYEKLCPKSILDLISNMIEHY